MSGNRTGCIQAVLLGPVFSFELVTTSRRLRYLLLRTLFAALLLAVLFVNYLALSDELNAGADRIRTAASFAHNVFAGFGWLTLLSVVLVGPLVAAGTLATERERRTIEYLFTSQLTNAEIVLGKLVVRLLQLGGVLLAGLPVLSIAMLLGGIAPTLVAGLIAMTASTAVFVTAIGLWQSAWSSTLRAAVNKSLRLMALIFLVGPLLGWLVLLCTVGGSAVPAWLQWLVAWIVAPLEDFLAIFNPFALFYMRDTLLGLGTFWWHVGTLALAQGTVSVICIGIAVATIRRAHTESSGKSAKVIALPWRNRTPVWQHAPMLWKEMFVERSGGTRLWLSKLAELVVFLGISGTAVGFFVRGVWYSDSQDEQLGFLVFPTMVMGVTAGGAAAVFAASRAASSITSERERDCWISILGTPQAAHEIVLAKWLGAVYSLRWVGAALLFVWLLPCTVRPSLLLAVAPAALAVLTTSCFGAALGTYISLVLLSSLRSIAVTIVIQLFIGGGYMFLVAPLVILARTEPPEEIFAGVVPFLSGAPFVLYFELMEFGFTPGRYFPYRLVMTCMWGNGGYLFGTIALLGMAIGSFGRLTGRLEEFGDVLQGDRLMRGGAITQTPPTPGKSADS